VKKEIEKSKKEKTQNPNHPIFVFLLAFSCLRLSKDKNIVWFEVAGCFEFDTSLVSIK